MQPATVETPRPTTVTKRWPTVRGHWLGGVMRQVQREPMTLYRRAWQSHGDYVRLRAFPGAWFYVISSPAAIEHVLVGNAKNYRKPDMFYKSVGLLTGRGTLTSEGESWRAQRKLIQPVFARHQVSKFGSHITRAIETLIDEWLCEPDVRELDVLPEMMRLALRVAGTALFSTDVSGEADSIGRAYRTAFDYVSRKMNNRQFTPLWMPTRRNREFRRSKALLDRVVLDLIAERRRGAARGDLLDRLLAAQDEQSGAGLSDEQLKDEVITLLTAGHETTGAALAWAWYLLAQNQEVQCDLADEARGVLQGRPPAVDDLPKLPLATAVFEEAMRLYPPAWGLPRQSVEADAIDGYPIESKAILVVGIFLIHRHPDYWQNPDAFDPRRFLAPAAQQRPKYTYLPFGGGSRVCLGNHFAMLEGPLALAALAQRFRFTLVEGHAIVPDPTFALRPKYGVKVTVSKRP